MGSRSLNADEIRQLLITLDKELQRTFLRGGGTSWRRRQTTTCQ